MNPLPFETIKAALIAALIGAALGFSYLWRHEVESFAEYRAQAEAVADRQKRHAIEVDEANRQTTEEIQHEHQTQLDALRAYYASRVLHTPARPGTMPGISKPPVSIDAVPSDALPLAGQCAETTLQLIDLQSWLVEVLKNDHLVVK